MKKISMIAHGLSDGGAERVESILANFLVERGYDVQFIAALTGNRVYELDERAHYFFKVAPAVSAPVRFIQKGFNVLQAIYQFKPDLIISFLTNEAFLAGIFYNSPSIYTLRSDPNNYNNSRVKEAIRQYLFHKGKAIIFQSPGAMQYFDKSIQVKGVVIGNPLKQGLPYWKEYEHEKAIVTACRLEKQKNVPLLLDAFALFKKDYPEYTLKICGDGALRKELEAYAKELGHETSVSFLGFRTDIHDIIAHASIFALSSDYEGVSNSMLEALSIGVPVVCTDSSPGGAAMYIQSGVNGYLTPIRDAEAMAAAFKRIADSDEHAQKLSENAVRIRQTLDQQTVLGEWENVIKRFM